MKTLILALDQGTTSSRAILFDKQGTIRAMAQKEFRQLYPKPGWVEHDPTEIWSSQGSVAREAMLSIDATPDDIAAIGITNQRETTVIWDKTNGKPIYPAIVWQDRRTASICHDLTVNGHADAIKAKTGLVLDAYFSGTKIKWILDNIPGARAGAENGELAFGTIDSWLLWKLTGGKIHATDVSNASRTLLFNLHTLQWDPEILSLLDIPRGLLPEIRSNSEVLGYATALEMPEVPIAGMAGDQQSALFGQMCTTPGMVKNTYGTGCFMLMNTGNKIVPSNNNLLTTIAWQIQGQTHYALEGSVFIGGAAVQWLRDGLNIVSSSQETESLAASVPSTDGVVLVPAFTGLGAPHWNPHARGTLFGISRGTTKAHIARATLESIALQTWDVLKAMEMDAGMPIVELRVDGGATVNQLLMQFQADILGVDVIRPREVETTALGAAYLAGLAVGFWHSTDEIASLWKTDTRFEAVMADAKKQQKLKEWQKAVQAVLTWSR
jgi:glycerol kinase